MCQLLRKMLLDLGIQDQNSNQERAPLTILKNNNGYNGAIIAFVSIVPTIVLTVKALLRPPLY